MFNKKKTLSIITILIIIIGFNIKVESSEISFSDNIKNLEGQMTLEKYHRFLKVDENYLENLKDKSNINKEIKELEKLLKDVDKEYTEVKGIKVYKGEAGLKNDGIRKAIKNREDLLKNENFKYDFNKSYTIDRGYTEKLANREMFTQREMDLAYESVIEVIENIELDTEFLKDTKFVISPHLLKGMNGYAVTRSNGKNTIVIGTKVMAPSEDWVRLSIKSTILHEIGHVFQSINNEKIKNTRAGKDYLIQADKILSNSSKEETWETSVNENFAEDFRVHFSNKMGDSSINPLKKKTFREYNEVEFTEVIESITK